MTTLWQASQSLLAGMTSPENLTRDALDAITDASGEGKRVFTNVYAERAEMQALQASTRWQQHQPRSPIDGLPVSIKDLFDVAGEVTLAGSHLLVNAAEAKVSASMVQRLEQAGTAIVGKTNMSEFAFTGLGINPHYGTPANPWQREQNRIPGGSSSGAAVAVTDGMCLASVGTDTGGSVRIPAALCGLTGFKPSASRITQTGTLPLAVSLDSIGVIAHDVRSCWLLDSVIANRPITIVERHLSDAHFAIPQTRVLDGLDQHVSRAWRNALDMLESRGVTLTEIPLKELDELETINARGGITAWEAWQWHKRHVACQPEAYDPQVLTRIKRGSLLNAQDANELYQLRASWKKRVENAVAPFDGMLMPTVPLIAPTIAELDDPARYMQVNMLMLRNPSVINMLDGCAISLPCHQPGDAPVGLMLASTHGNDAALLSWAASIESTLKRSI
ncbi:amidase [Dickeya solani]|uniref:Amidase n=1 Tax=Dickeya solani TaxID=1089444 RepID=A0AAX4EYW7_9GAMM|nr:amidase [Dickeya solani]WOA51917.1 amidase [Dickeya solani]